LTWQKGFSPHGFLTTYRLGFSKNPRRASTNKMVARVQWSDLPGLVFKGIMEIFTLSCTSVSFLNRSPRELGEIRLVCKGWRSHCDQHIVKLILHNVYTPTTVIGMSNFLRKFPSVKAVIVLVRGETGTGGPMWAKAVDSLVSLTSLSYNGGSYNGDCFQVLAGFTALTRLHIKCRVSSVLGLEVLSSLQTLDLRGTSSVLDDDAFSSLSGLVNLTDLNLSDCDKLSSTHGFATLTCFTALTILNLMRTQADDSVLLGTVSTLSALKQLFFSRPPLHLARDGEPISTHGVRGLISILPEISICVFEFGSSVGHWITLE
jgi:hypothetical protein